MMLDVHALFFLMIVIAHCIELALRSFLPSSFATPSTPFALSPVSYARRPPPCVLETHLASSASHTL